MQIYPISIIRNQLQKIERALGHKEIEVQRNVQNVLEALQFKKLTLQGKEFSLQGEEVDVYDGVGKNARKIGQIDRNIADKFGYIHETVNAIVISPDKTKVLLTRRAHNKHYPLALTIPGGHLIAGQKPQDGMVSELEEELELPSLNGKLEEVALYSYGVHANVPNDTTRERRVLYVYHLTEAEYQQVLDRQKELEKIASDEGEDGLKKALEVRQFEGVGEVWSYHDVLLEELLSAGVSLQITDILSGFPMNIPFTPDLLTHLLNSPDLVAKTRAVIRDMAMNSEIKKYTINSDKKGGIDLTPSNMNLQTLNLGDEIKFHLDPAMLQQLQNAPGFVPVIINIQPLKSLQEFLGLNQTTQSTVG